MPFNIEPLDLVIVLIVALIVFGPSRLPEIGRGMGRAISEFRHGTRAMVDEFSGQMNQPAQPRSSEPSPAPRGDGGKACTRCGSTNLDGARFCNHCGAKLTD